MNQTRQTLAFVVVATVLAGVAVATHLASRTTSSREFEKVGTVFYDRFDDPNKATSLRVVSYNEDEARVSQFQVEFRDGLWRIPSHHNYPADAKDRLAKAAASLIAVQRDTLASRRDSDHERFGVIDPETDDLTQLKGLGQRVTLKDSSGTVLADLIIGNKVEGQEGYYYVRRPDEKETFRAKLDIDLSTRFANWIEQDLLKMDRWNAVRLVLSRPGVNEEGRIIDRERVELSRADTAGQWTLVGLDEQTEEVNRTGVDDLLRNLDELEIVGVRPKPRGITADIKLEIPASVSENPLAVRAFRDALLTDLERKGFGIGGDVNDQPRIFSREGEVLLATNDGVAYHLHLGDVFTGTLEEVEIGGKSDAEEDADGKEAADAASHAEPDAPSSDDGRATDDPPKDESGVKLHRYVFVRAQFDPAHIGPEPVQPEEPPRPEGLQDDAAASTTDQADPDADQSASPEVEPQQEGGSSPAAANGDAAPDAANGDEQPDDGSPADAGDASEDARQPADESADAAKQEPADEQARLKAEYDKALAAYRTSLQEYERKKADYDRKLKEGREKVEDLNRRFRDWYYVISGASLENLKIARADLVKPKTASQDAAAPGSGQPSADEPGEAASDPADQSPDAARPQANGDAGADDSAAPEPEGAATDPAATDPAATGADTPDGGAPAGDNPPAADADEATPPESAEAQGKPDKPIE